MRGQTLANLVIRLKSQLSDAQETNTAQDNEYKYLLAQCQQDYANAFDWPFLDDKWDMPCAAGSRYLTLPTADTQARAYTINFERPIKVDRYYNSFYNGIDYGIGVNQYNFRNSDLGQAQDPIRNWQMVSNSSDAVPNQVEVWPIPTSAQVVRFTGQRNVLALAVDADKADLDDLLLVYTVALDKLLLRDQKSAEIMARKLDSHLKRLRAGYPNAQNQIKLGGGSTYEVVARRLVPMVVVAP